MLRYVILHHETPPDFPRATHWDFMLEAGERLRTWALAEAPARGRAIPADALADHRLAYLDYEGPVAENRGSVTRWDAGEYRVLEETDGLLVVQLSGRRIDGVARLSRGTFLWAQGAS